MVTLTGNRPREPMTWRRCSLSPLAAVRLRNSCDSFLRTGFHMKRFGALSAARLAPVCHGRRAGTVGRMGMARRSGRTDYVDFTHLVPSGTVTACPYKGTTSGYWSVRVGGTEHADLAWAYDFPTRQLLPISGLVAFYNEKADIFLDGLLLDRPATHFS